MRTTVTRRRKTRSAKIRRGVLMGPKKRRSITTTTKGPPAQIRQRRSEQPVWFGRQRSSDRWRHRQGDGSGAPSSDVQLLQSGQRRDKGSEPRGVARNVGHFALDVVPYWFAEPLRGDEGTTAGQRVLGPENYKRRRKRGLAPKAGSETKRQAWARRSRQAGGLTDWFGSKDNDHDADKQYVQ